MGLNSEMLDDFNRVLWEMRASGLVETIEKGWIEI